ncbi:epoxyqueuosine reductase QueH [Atopobiaceae bacterium 24-176]
MSVFVPVAVHACCGPCSLEPVRLLREEGMEPMIFWTNPNIQPVAEHERRLETLKGWAESEGIEVVVCADDRSLWEHAVAPKGFDRVARCRACYALRLAETCRAAKERGFSLVTTTLAVSPYQLHDVCDEVLVAIAGAHGLEPVARDFRGAYPQATQRSLDLGMYRQNYCGCRFSAVEASLERAQAREERKRLRKGSKRGA